MELSAGSLGFTTVFLLLQVFVNCKHHEEEERSRRRRM
jgi:hypothetical protein